jgi:hypothetical protein
MYIIIIIILREEHSIYPGRLAGSTTKEKFISEEKDRAMEQGQANDSLQPYC